MKRQANSIMPTLGLKVWWSEFECPYCHRTWQRGGGKEGFVKSGASNHVAACREIVFFLAGYVMGPTWGTVIPIAQAEKLAHWPRWRRQILALIASRKRAGLAPERPR